MLRFIFYSRLVDLLRELNQFLRWPKFMVDKSELQGNCNLIFIVGTLTLESLKQQVYTGIAQPGNV